MGCTRHQRKYVVTQGCTAQEVRRVGLDSHPRALPLGHGDLEQEEFPTSLLRAGQDEGG
jgi:hypothetical protein